MLRFAVLFQAIMATVAVAQPIDAENIAIVVGSSEICGYALSDAKVKDAVHRIVVPSSEDDRHAFQYMLTIQASRLQNMSDIERTAQCSLQEKLAETYGLTP